MRLRLESATLCPSVGVRHVGLWTTQILMAAFFVHGGVGKLATLTGDLSRAVPLTAESPALLAATGLAACLVGLSILWPAMTRLWPSLYFPAAFELLAPQRRHRLLER